jgi:AcrR family transcriptional regulator
VTDDVKRKPSRKDRALRTDLVAQTEERIIAAATELFERDGFSATTLSAIAERAGVGDRTVYVRFGTKVALFHRVVQAAITGGPGGPEWAKTFARSPAMTAPTVAARVADYAHYSRLIMERTSRLFAVAQRAAGLEPEIEVYWQRGRMANRRTVERFWAAMRRDGLLPDGLDEDWLLTTAVLLGAADTYLTMTRFYDGDLDRYEAWLAASYLRLIPAAG